MSRSTFSGPVNAGKKTLANLTAVAISNSTKWVPQVGTALLTQQVSHNAATTTVAASASVDYAFVIPKFAKLLRISTATGILTAAGGTITLSVGSTLGGAEYVAGVTVALTGGVVARTLLPAAMTDLQKPTSDKVVYVRLAVATTDWTAGQIDVVAEYIQYADATQVIVAPKV
jgi:hypothetical protein